MSVILPDDLKQPISFEFSGHKDAPDEIEDNVNAVSGKTLLQAFKVVLLDNGWSESTERYDSEVFAEDWGWCVFLRHEENLMMLGMHVLAENLFEDKDYKEYLDRDWVEGGIFVEPFHKRTLIDRLRGQNRADPTAHERAFRSIWDTLAALSYIRNLSTEHPDNS